MKLTRVESFGEGLRYLLEADACEIDLTTERNYNVLIKGVISTIQSKLVEELYPQIRDRALQQFVTDEQIHMAVADGIRARLANMLAPSKDTSEPNGKAPFAVR